MEFPGIPEHKPINALLPQILEQDAKLREERRRRRAEEAAKQGVLTFRRLTNMEIGGDVSRSLHALLDSRPVSFVANVFLQNWKA